MVAAEGPRGVRLTAWLEDVEALLRRWQEETRVGEVDSSPSLTTTIIIVVVFIIFLILVFLAAAGLMALKARRSEDRERRVEDPVELPLIKLE